MYPATNETGMYTCSDTRNRQYRLGWFIQTGTGRATQGLKRGRETLTRDSRSDEVLGTGISVAVTQVTSLNHARRPQSAGNQPALGIKTLDAAFQWSDPDGVVGRQAQISLDAHSHLLTATDHPQVPLGTGRQYRVNGNW